TIETLKIIFEAIFLLSVMTSFVDFPIKFTVFIAFSDSIIVFPVVATFLEASLVKEEICFEEVPTAVTVFFTTAETIDFLPMAVILPEVELTKLANSLELGSFNMIRFLVGFY